MDPETAEVFKFVGSILPWITAIVGVTVGGWIFTTWLRIKNGYPLETSWGQPLHPSSDNEAKYGHSRRRERGEEGISAQEHAETLRLREEVKALKERLHVLERIAVEKEDSLSRQIEELRDR